MSTKRRVTAAASSDSKRQKISDDVATAVETPQKTTEIGLKLLSHIKQSTDKNGRQIVTSFLHLPDREENPEYYEVTMLPIALDTVEDKLNRRQYPTLTALESDLKRMVTNAKSFNERSSLAFADAERVRKILSNNMPKINPAYKDPKYVAFPTPLPNEPIKDSEDVNADTQDSDSASEAAASSTTSRQGTPRIEDSQPSHSPPLVEDHSQSGDFEGCTLRDAQEKIISEMIHLKDIEGQGVAVPFLSKPDRSVYKDYYEVIQHPVSLRSLQKQVRGTDHKRRVTKAMAFPTWQSFEDEVEFIWRNAREFNEDGSEVFVSAGVLEHFCKRRVAEAKRLVPDPAPTNRDNGPPRLKLRMAMNRTPDPTSQRLTLKMPVQKADASGGDKLRSGIAVDSESLGRQQELAKASSTERDGHHTAAAPITRSLRRAPSTPTQNGAKATGAKLPQRGASLSSPAHSTAATVKSETRAPSSPGPTAVDSRASSHDPSQPAGQSPDPILSVESSADSGVTPSHQSGSPLPTSHAVSQPHVHAVPSISPLDSILWQPGKDASDALISNISIFTHPSLDLPHDFHLNIPPSRTACQHSVIINLPPTHNFVSLHPSVAPSTPHRLTKLIVSLGSQRLQVSTQTQQNNAVGQIYDTHLNPGVTKIDFEVICYPVRGASTLGTAGSDFEYEHVTLYLNLLQR